LIFYKTARVLFQEFEPAFRRTRYRVDTGSDSICFDWLSDAEEHIYLALDTASPISLTLSVNHKPVGRWEQAA
jgi:hypothetical protein